MSISKIISDCTINSAENVLYQRNRGVDKLFPVDAGSIRTGAGLHQEWVASTWNLVGANIVCGTVLANTGGGRYSASTLWYLIFPHYILSYISSPECVSLWTGANTRSGHPSTWVPFTDGTQRGGREYSTIGTGTLYGRLALARIQPAINDFPLYSWITRQ